MNTALPPSVFESSRLAGLVALLIGWAALAGCGQETRCADGACPYGMRCETASGLCVDVASDTAGSAPVFAGRWSLLALDGARIASVGYDVKRRSLVWAERDGNKVHQTLLAGLGAGDDGPAGEASSAVVDSAGRAHVVWLRRSDSSAWYGRVDGENFERSPLVLPGDLRPGERFALAIHAGEPVLAFVAAGGGGVRLGRRAAAGTWSVETVPPPPASPAGPPSIEGDLAIAADTGSVAVAWYDPVGGDLIVATRSASWQVSRIAGRHGATGADDGDAGSPCQLARDTLGGLVVAWRDRSRNHVEWARSAGGNITRAIVTDGAYVDPALGVTRRDTVGTALDAVMLANGRLAIAWQNASRSRIELAVQGAGGGLQRQELPNSGRIQLRPRLLARVDGGFWLGWLELEPALGGGRLVLWNGAGQAGGP